MSKYSVLLSCLIALPIYANVTITCPASLGVRSTEGDASQTFPWLWHYELGGSYGGYGYSKFSGIEGFQGVVLAADGDNDDVLCSYEGGGETTATAADGHGYTINDRGHTNCHFDTGTSTTAVDSVYWQSSSDCTGETVYSTDNVACTDTNPAACNIVCDN